VVRTGAVPVLVDSDPLTWNMNVHEIEDKITPRTRAIIAVHIYGLPVDMDPLLKIAKKYNLKVIEDAAEMHGQTYKNKPCGSFGDISVFSFYPNKHVTTGEGGMIVTDDENIAEKCRGLRNLCFQKQRRFVHEELGWNFRMTNLQAALGIAQLERLDEFAVKKREMGKLYHSLLKDTELIQLPLEKTEYAENIYWVYGIILDKELPFDAEYVMRKLAEKGIGTRPFFWPMHEQPVFRKMGLFQNDKHPVAENIARRGFYLPSGLALTAEQIERSAETLIKLLKEEYVSI
jgi:perosamine synthetase